MRARTRLAALLAILTATTPALATGELADLVTPADSARLENYQATRSEALREAHAGQPADQTAALDRLVNAEALPWRDFDMTGDWQCRTVKAGGLAPLVVYGWFRCRVSDDGSGWRLRKLNGSQRTDGRFFDDGENRLVYLGSFAVNDDPFPPYGSGPESDQVGYAFRTGDRSFRIEFPAPYYESKLDILEFRR